jgi:hypothetical protein
MKRIQSIFLLVAFSFLATTVHAQFRSIPGVVTDSFKAKYPSASAVKWADKVTAFQATFTLDGETLQARYNSKGEWQQSQKNITEDKLPAAVKDGLSKSKYADWKIEKLLARYLPGNKTQYGLSVSNGSITKKNLLFSSEGQLLKDNTTL